MNSNQKNTLLSKLSLPCWPFAKNQFSEIRIPELRFGDLVAKIPIIQGGMGVGISLSGLASAVAQEGGIGVIAANGIGMIEPDYFKNGKEANKRALRNEIRRARVQTKGIIGVNIMVAIKDYVDLLNIAIEEKADIIFLGAGLPLKGIPLTKLRQTNVKIVPIVSSARAARLIFTYWQTHYKDIPDGVVVEGPLAGGHLGFKIDQLSDPGHNLEKLIPETVAEIKTFTTTLNRQIPVVAAGGIYNGEDILKFIRLGAAGVQMGTRFVSTHECDADIRFKKAYINCQKNDIVIIKSPVGLLGRAIKNDYIEKMNAGEKASFSCPWQCLANCAAQKAQYCISIALNNARKGNLKHGFAFAGANAYRVNEIVSVHEMMTGLLTGFVQAVEKETRLLISQFDKILAKMNSIKNVYGQMAEKVFKSVKSECEKVVAKSSQSIKSEYTHILKKLDALKNEYLEHFSQLSHLHKELATYFV